MHHVETSLSQLPRSSMVSSFCRSQKQFFPCQILYMSPMATKSFGTRQCIRAVVLIYNMAHLDKYFGMMWWTEPLGVNFRNRSSASLGCHNFVVEPQPQVNALSGSARNALSNRSLFE